MIVATAILLSIGAAAFLLRLVIGPNLPDRVVALDGLAATIVAGIIVTAAVLDAGYEVDIVLVVALVGFVGASVFARFVERRGG